MNTSIMIINTIMNTISIMVTNTTVNTIIMITNFTVNTIVMVMIILNTTIKVTNTIMNTISIMITTTILHNSRDICTVQNTKINHIIKKRTTCVCLRQGKDSTVSTDMGITKTISHTLIHLPLLPVLTVLLITANMLK
jgi:hypothetical protein